MPISSHELDLAYMAGILDGEGCITIARSMPRNRYDDRRRNPLWWSSTCYTLGVAVAMTDPIPPYMFHFEFGGSLIYSKSRHMWRWGVYANLAVGVLTTLLPYLKGKKPQAELGIRFQTERVNFSRNGRGNEISGEELSKRDSMYVEMVKLKRPWLQEVN